MNVRIVFIFLIIIYMMEVKNILFRNLFRYNYFILFLFVLIFLFLSLSSVSAAEYNFTSNNTTEDFQSVIDSDGGDELVINLDDGSNYILGQINVTRNATIQGKNNEVLKSLGWGLVFCLISHQVMLKL